MIITEKGGVVAFVGEVIVMAGRVCRCVQDSPGDACFSCFLEKQTKELCNIMECTPEGRPDGLYVHFELYEGGKDGK